MGVVVTEVLHFVILMVGSAVFMFIAVAQHGGWHAVLQRIAARPARSVAARFRQSSPPRPPTRSS